MSDYTRATRECAPAQLQPELLSAIRAYAQQHDLGDVEGAALLCCETRSEKKKKGLFGGLGGGDPDPYHTSALIVTPAWIVWARGGPKRGVVVASARLREARLSAFDSKLIPDSGLEVQSPQPGTPEPVSAFVPLAQDVAAGITERVKAIAAKAAA
jgi:hypothetical protein